MADTFAALIVKFSPDLCSLIFRGGRFASRTAGIYLGDELGKHLETNGHTVSSRRTGGLSDSHYDYLESKRANFRYKYIITYFPRRDDDRWMLIKYDLNIGWLKRLFGATSDIPIGDPIHKVLRDFGEKFEDSKLLKRSEINAAH